MTSPVFLKNKIPNLQPSVWENEDSSTEKPISVLYKKDRSAHKVTCEIAENLFQHVKISQQDSAVTEVVARNVQQVFTNQDFTPIFLGGLRETKKSDSSLLLDRWLRPSSISLVHTKLPPSRNAFKETCSAYDPKSTPKKSPAAAFFGLLDKEVPKKLGDPKDSFQKTTIARSGEALEEEQMILTAIHENAFAPSLKIQEFEDTLEAYAILDGLGNISRVAGYPFQVVAEGVIHTFQQVNTFVNTAFPSSADRFCGPGGEFSELRKSHPAVTHFCEEFEAEKDAAKQFGNFFSSVVPDGMGEWICDKLVKREASLLAFAKDKEERLGIPVSMTLHSLNENVVPLVTLPLNIAGLGALKGLGELALQTSKKALTNVVKREVSSAALGTIAKIDLPIDVSFPVEITHSYMRGSQVHHLQPLSYILTTNRGQTEVHLGMGGKTFALAAATAAPLAMEEGAIIAVESIEAIAEEAIKEETAVGVAKHLGKETVIKVGEEELLESIEHFSHELKEELNH